MSGCLCGASWLGDKTCHCTMCHCTWTSVKVFDRHRAGPWSARYCRDPKTYRNPKTGELVFADARRDYECFMLKADQDRPLPLSGWR